MDIEQFTIINNKLDKLDSRIDNVDITLAKQSILLDEHIKRTGIAEENIGMLRADLKPVEAHVSMVQGAIKLIAFGAVIIGAAAGIVRIISAIYPFFR